MRKQLAQEDKGGEMRGKIQHCAVVKVWAMKLKCLLQSQSAPPWLGDLHKVICPLCALVSKAGVTIIPTSVGSLGSKLGKIYKALRTGPGTCYDLCEFVK